MCCKEGLLSKFSIGKGTFGKRKNWKDRWFVLDEDGMKYYGKKSDKGSHAYKGFIRWAEVVKIYDRIDSHVHSSATDPKCAYFGLQFKAKGRGEVFTLLLKSDSCSERDAWVENMSVACGILCNSDTIRALQEEEEINDDFMANGSNGKTSALHILKSLVSKNKRRYIANNFNLDLVYVTPQLIAMGYPASGREAFYRNSLEEVEQFLGLHHKSHFRVYNLCKEREYSKRVLSGAWERFPFEDHTPPPLELLPRILRSLRKFLECDPSNVVAVHCKAGKGRTGTVICSYLCAYEGMRPGEALELFATKRTTDGKGVTIPSQRRYVRYADVLMKRECLPTVTVRIVGMHLANVNSNKLTADYAADMYFTVSQRGQADDDDEQLSGLDVLIDSRVDATVERIKDPSLAFSPSMMSLGCVTAPSGLTALDMVMKKESVAIRGDLKITFFIESKSMFKSDQEVFHAWLHTSFLTGDDPTGEVTVNPDTSLPSSVEIARADLDGLHKEKGAPVQDLSLAMHYTIESSTTEHCHASQSAVPRPRGNAFAHLTRRANSTPLPLTEAKAAEVLPICS
eukprot:TRINITY_DN7096_c0_g1_i1.p1 TRINITY_DN7096_c0_g1~~TRINITY_DN7096_c0_g1_i1.p1  ORF type:complete len:569 (+),score=154.25 TRINITY_DN7096_c0_g1_i1:59-1765(+)